jgi:glycosyltransferase involved in cell wall biosynthesis
MTFSVIIPTYNRSLYLFKCLKSLCSQTFKDFEVIICDDGSTDNTIEVVNQFKQFLDIKYILIGNSGGPAKPRNEAIKNCVGKWICFLDVDDYWFEDKLQRCLSHTESADLIYHDMIIEDALGIKTGVFKGRKLDENDMRYDLLANFNAIATSSVCIKREIFIATGQFDEAVDYRFIEDFDYWLRASETTTNFKYIPETLGTYVEHTTNSSSDFIGQARRLEKLYYKYSIKLDNAKKAKNVINAYHYLAACLFEKAKNYRSATTHFSKSLSCLNPIVRLKSLIKIVKYYAFVSKNV